MLAETLTLRARLRDALQVADRVAQDLNLILQPPIGVDAAHRFVGDVTLERLPAIDVGADRFLVVVRPHVDLAEPVERGVELRVERRGRRANSVSALS